MVEELYLDHTTGKWVYRSLDGKPVITMHCGAGKLLQCNDGLRTSVRYKLVEKPGPNRVVIEFKCGNSRTYDLDIGPYQAISKVTVRGVEHVPK